MNREQVKTLILTALIIMSIIFTQKIWLYSPAKVVQSEASSKGDQIETNELRIQLVAPRRAIVSFGNNNYTIITSNIKKLWEETRKVLTPYFQGEPEIIPTTNEKYRESSRLKSIELEFGENISSVLVASVFDKVDSKLASDIRAIKKIVIPTANKGVIYVVGAEDKVYEVKLNNYEENKQLNTYVDSLQERNQVKYYPLFADVDNYTLMPLSYQKPTPLVFVESEINIENEAIVMDRVKSFFNENLDFVKTINETSGAVIFMYGYGEKGVRINNIGRIEYTQEIGADFSSNVVAALDVAINFVENHGGFPEGTYLQEIKHEDKKGYYFGFGYRIEELPVLFNNPNIGHPIEIEIYGNKVKSYHSFIRKNMMLPDVIANSYTELPQKIIEDNIQMLMEDYLLDTKGNQQLVDKELLSFIEKNISEIELVYYDTMEDTRRQLLIPTWKIKINKRVYYFNSYDGELLHSSLVK